MGHRITRKQLKQDDEFVSTAELIFRWLAGNIRPLLAGVGAVVRGDMMEGAIEGLGMLRVKVR